jgi:AmmeMemoRadiSam system protein B
MKVRPAAVAGAFYPADRSSLERLVATCLADAVLAEDGAPAPKALVVPHAGLIYSGPVAATAYRRVAIAAERIERVVLLGPSHRVTFGGIATSSADAFDTPLGPMPVDRDAVERALGVPRVFEADEAHGAEHCLEVQLPFLKTLLPTSAIAPFVVGDATPDEVAALLAELWGGPETLVVISTDLSHYHRYHEAQDLDQRTAAAIVAMRPDLIGGRDACGSRPLRGLLVEAAHRHLQVEALDLRNSGDTAGDRSRVVGYGAFAIG